MRRHRPLLTAGSLVIVACSGSSDARTEDPALPPGAVEVLLEAEVSDRGSDGRLMWSP